MKVVCISDTHGQHEHLIIPNGKMIVHTGDFTNNGSERKTDEFLLWYSNLPHQYKLLIAGNHDWYPYTRAEEFRKKCHTLGIIYLEDSYITIEGIKFYGTPWVPRFFDWAFMEEDYDLVPIYNKIPDDTQVLLTHGPAFGVLDAVPRGHVGSSALSAKLYDHPSITHHIFGHIHESAGKLRLKNYTALNAACVDHKYNPRKVQSLYIKPKESHDT
jgi:Icc-related predicted phosphoesterase